MIWFMAGYIWLEDLIGIADAYGAEIRHQINCLAFEDIGITDCPVDQQPPNHRCGNPYVAPPSPLGLELHDLLVTEDCCQLGRAELECPDGEQAVINMSIAVTIAA